MSLIILGQNDNPCEGCPGNALNCMGCKNRPKEFDLKAENEKPVWPYTLGVVAIVAGVIFFIL